MTIFYLQILQATAIRESRVTDVDYTIGDGDRSQAAAARESIVTDACYAVRDVRFAASNNQFIRLSLNDGITVFTRIINEISLFNR